MLVSRPDDKSESKNTTAGARTGATAGKDIAGDVPAIAMRDVELSLGEGPSRVHILRGVSLLGVDSVMQPKEIRIKAWDRIAQDLDLEKLNAITTIIGFDDIVATAGDIVEGKVRGRVAVDMKA